MIADLEKFETDEIHQAFTLWRQQSEKIPTPAAIIKLINKSKPQPAYTPPDGRENKGYYDLTDEGRALFNKAMELARFYLNNGIILEKPIGSVPWYAKKWKHYTQEDKDGLRKHCDELAAKKDKEFAQGYINYLNEYCDVPKRFLEI